MLVLGWDGAEWSMIRGLCEAGKMPHLQSFLEHGTSANIASLQPMLSPLLWTTMVTGKRAHDHGILGFVENSLEGPRAISNLQRKVPALWNILSESGLKCQVLNWWPSNPAEKIKGQFVSNLAFSAGSLRGQTWPADLAELLKQKKSSPEDLDEGVLRGFFPYHTSSALREDDLVEKIARILARTKHQFDVSMELLSMESDCRFFYFEALDQIQHLAGKFVEDNDSPYQFIVEAAYRWHDEMLGSFLNRAKGHNVMIMSDHGFNLRSSKAELMPELPAALALDHQPYAFFAAAGPDVDVESEIFGMSLLDITPTLLHYFKLPQGKDMSGRKQSVFSFQHPLSFIPSWDGLLDIRFQFPEKHQSLESIKDLEELEYIDLSGNDLKSGIEEEQDYNRAVSLKEVGRFQEAQQISEHYRTSSPKPYRWQILHARLFTALNDQEGWVEFQQSLSQEQKLDPHLLFNKALMLLQAGQAEDALLVFQAMEEKGMGTSALGLEMGQALFLAGELKAAEKQIDKVLALNSDSAAALNSKAQIAFALGEEEDFKIWANRSLQLKMHQPQLHYLWASLYFENGDQESAQKALQFCLQIAPRHQKALALMEQLSGKVQKSWTYVVSGFPRSGTSFMMSLLQQSGFSIISDNHRSADEHNPRGYFEWEELKNISDSSKSLMDTHGKTIKVVAPLLPYLPADRAYRVIWMDRPTLELILSQAKMKGEPTDLQNFPFRKGQQLEEEKKRLQTWLNQQPNVEWIEISYPKLMQESYPDELERLTHFLDREISSEHWEIAADPQLHRNKIG